MSATDVERYPSRPNRRTAARRMAVRVCSPLVCSPLPGSTFIGVASVTGTEDNRLEGLIQSLSSSRVAHMVQNSSESTARKVPTRRISFEESLQDLPKHFAADGD